MTSNGDRSHLPWAWVGDSSAQGSLERTGGIVANQPHTSVERLHSFEPVVGLFVNLVADHQVAFDI